jgi:ElaB/YqjD/DUF883 family membrane-anchored ribosome-binding protein
MATSNTSFASTVALAAAESAADRLREAQDAAQGLTETVRRGGAAVQEARDAWSGFDDALRETVRARPWAAVAIAGAIGFLYAIARRR